ncbi:hypothetical protein JTB14_012480 [Gonioctena quinquepunctata]|nr:hypothetical protein JTB14_012480 [Gonioctena quinquepunctata]
MDDLVKVKNTANKLVPPDGGWGYIITGSLIVVMYVSLVPCISFGLLFGEFLTSIGDEANGTSLVNSILFAVMSFTGFASSLMLQKFSIRSVGFVGAISYFIGCLSNIFGTNLSHMVISYSFLKGFGYGLIQASAFTILNSYFDKKYNLIMGIFQTIVSLGTIAGPPVIAAAVEHMGFRETLVLLTGLSLLNFPAIFTFRPVDRYLRKQCVESGKESVPESEPENPKSQVQPLLLAYNEKEPTTAEEIQHKRNPTSIIMRKWLLDDIGLRLFADLKYINMAIGLAIPFTSDIFFSVFSRMILNNLNYQSSEIAMIMMVYFCCDLVIRLFYTAVSGLCVIHNKILFLVSAIAMATFRIVFMLRDDYSWRMITISLVGLSRGIMETTLPLVISEIYKDDFSTAYSLYMVVSGCVSLVFGCLNNYVHAVTQSDAMLICFMAVANYLTCFLWILEIVYEKLTKKKLERNDKGG